MPLNILLLGGSSEASALADRLSGDARFNAVLSLAGRTAKPKPAPISQRFGGFGGVAGLIDYLARERVDALVVALHPFAAQMRGHAIAAATAQRTPLLIVDRPPWHPQPGDHWTCVADMMQAAQALGVAPQRVLLTVGRQDLAPFKSCPQHAYFARSIDAPQTGDLPANTELLLARGPFSVADEQALLSARRIDVIVTKNAGAQATEAKLTAARALDLPVIMVERPPRPSGAHDNLFAPSVAAAWAWLVGLHHSSGATERGV
ncbi:MAG: cobalt-precorrin-6A reductase [Caulobacteraceae bacterium]